MTGKNIKAIRCAIYTRKSSEEGLDQEFNSLHAQREACEAYIQSQKHEGWSVLPQHYDDGGISGATMNRPALRCLFDDIKSGKVDTIVVYKIDRLTRSLADFAKMVEVFDECGITFVSVTQQFNTTTSMGRLTLNVLLSFAQFEREVTGERIRDKIAASKKKGMWMGGTVPLGYDAKDRNLVINENEAKTVRHIFCRYVDLGSVQKLGQELQADGITSKHRISKTGRVSGGNTKYRGALYLMLQNRIYLGEIVHKEKSYPGKHDAIVNRELWDKVQAKLISNRVERSTGSAVKDPSLLAGLMFDGDGNTMTPTHAVKNGKRYRYYISRPLTITGRKSCPTGIRIPAREIERLVCERLKEFLLNPSDIADALKPHTTDSKELRRVIDGAGKLAEGWPGKSPSRRRSVLMALIHRIDILDNTTAIHLSVTHLCKMLQDGLADNQEAASSCSKECPLTLKVDFDLKRRGLGMRMLIDGKTADGKAKPDKKLIGLIVRAHRIRQRLTNSNGLSISDVARQEGFSSSYATRLLRLAFLSPKITAAILNGRQPSELTPATIMRDTKYPLDWQQQLQVFNANQEIPG